MKSVAKTFVKCGRPIHFEAGKRKWLNLKERFDISGNNFKDEIQGFLFAVSSLLQRGRF